MKIKSYDREETEDLASKGKNMSEGDSIIKRLSEFSEELQDAGSDDKKIELLVTFDKIFIEPSKRVHSIFIHII